MLVPFPQITARFRTAFGATAIVCGGLLIGGELGRADEPRQTPAAERVLENMITHARSHPDGRSPHSFDHAAYASDTRDLPIGVFDSGIGGLTVLEAILSLDAFDNDSLRPGADGRRDFEHESFVYLGDQANMPYGNYAAAGKEAFLRELIVKDAIFLLGRRYFAAPAATAPAFDKPPVKAIVIACNTATAYGLDDIRTAVQAWGIPVVVVGVVEAGARGVAEGADAAVPQTVAVLATVGTCSSMAYPKAIARTMGLAGKRLPLVVQQPSVGLAEAIENDPKAADDFIREDLQGLVEQHRRVDGAGPISTVVLGCTHFPLVKEQLQAEFERLRQHRSGEDRPYENVIAEQIRWVDPAELTAKELFRELARTRLRRGGASEEVPGHDRLFISTPNPGWPTVELNDAGGLEHRYKYGRQAGQPMLEDTQFVPMRAAMLPPASLNLIRTRLPMVSERLP